MREEDPVQAQLEAYNRRDVHAFLACYAEDACIRDGQGAVLFHGHEAIRDRYGSLFERNPGLRASVAGRLQAGAWTVDEERVVIDGEPVHILVAYRVDAGLIRDVVMMRSDTA